MDLECQKSNNSKALFRSRFALKDKITHSPTWLSIRSFFPLMLAKMPDILEVNRKVCRRRPKHIQSEGHTCKDISLDMFTPLLKSLILSAWKPAKASRIRECWGLLTATLGGLCACSSPNTFVWACLNWISIESALSLSLKLTQQLRIDRQMMDGQKYGPNVLFPCSLGLSLITGTNMDFSDFPFFSGVSDKTEHFLFQL